MGDIDIDISEENVNQLYHIFRVAGHSEVGSGICPTIRTLRDALTASLAREAAALLAAAGECYDREDARAIRAIATQPQTDALQAMIDAAVKDGARMVFDARIDELGAELALAAFNNQSGDDIKQAIAGGMAARDRFLAKIGGAS